MKGRNGGQKPVLQKISVPKTYDVLADQLRKTILEGGLEVGSRLPTERELVDQTGLSRGSVREALRKLEVEGLVSARVGRSGGNIVTRPDTDWMARWVGQYARSRRLPMRTLQEARETIEPAIARLAAANRSRDDLTRLRALNKELVNKTNARQFAEINIQWHAAVAAASKNELLASFLHAMSYGVMRATSVEVFDSEEIHTAVCRAHERIVQAIADRDGDAAFRRMERHILATRLQAKGREETELPMAPFPE